MAASLPLDRSPSAKGTASVGSASSTGIDCASDRPEGAPVRAWIDARGEAPWRVVGGIPLVTRLVRSLELEGVRRVAIVCDAARPTADFGARLPGTQISCAVRRAGDEISRSIGEVGSEEVALCVDGALVIDRRLLRALLASPAPCVVPPPPGDDRVGLALLGPPDAARFGAPLDARDPVRRLVPGQLPAFSEEMRGETAIVYRAARTPDAAFAAGRALVRATQKHVMDAPARWLDPPIENAIVTRIAPTRLTPNHVTIACTVLGFAGAWLLWNGAFALALPVLYVVGWLDGVDGKLARLRLHYSTLGAWRIVLRLRLRERLVGRARSALLAVGRAGRRSLGDRSRRRKPARRDRVYARTCEARRRPRPALSG